MKHALTLDVEDYFQVAAFKDQISPCDWPAQASRVERNTHRFLEITDAHSVKATFFFLGWVAERFPNLVREVVSQGHEIACHGFSHQLIYEQSPEAFKQETLRSKALLEDQSQTDVTGYRAASYSVTPKSLWALDIISEAGFEYDSSIYPIRHDNYGLQGGPHVPYKIELASGTHLVEFPITTAPLASLNIPVGGGGYFRLLPYSVTKRLLDRRQGLLDSPFVFYLHPWELDPDQPRIEGASAKSRFRHYLNLDKVEDRLNSLLRDFEFGTMREVLASCDNLPTHSYQNA